VKTSSGEDERIYRETWDEGKREEEKIEDKEQSETEIDTTECRDEIGRDDWLYIEEIM